MCWPGDVDQSVDRAATTWEEICSQFFFIISEGILLHAAEKTWKKQEIHSAELEPLVFAPSHGWKQIATFVSHKFTIFSSFHGIIKSSLHQKHHMIWERKGATVPVILHRRVDKKSKKSSFDWRKHLKCVLQGNSTKQGGIQIRFAYLMGISFQRNTSIYLQPPHNAPGICWSLHRTNKMMMVDINLPSDAQLMDCEQDMKY